MDFSSKIDAWLVPCLALPPLAGVGAAVAGAVGGQPPALYIGAGMTLFVLLLYRGVVLPVRYTISADALVARHGALRQRVAYADITAVEPTRNPLSAPALSLDRLAVRQGDAAALLISPADKSGFLDALAAKTPHLRRDGDALVTAGES